jgi:hypothetical protein
MPSTRECGTASRPSGGKGGSGRTLAGTMDTTRDVYDEIIRIDLWQTNQEG